MPIYEFKCLKCDNFIEILLMNNEDKLELKCSKCGGEELERVLSAGSYSMGSASGSNSKVKSRTRTCSSGSCTTYEIPGMTR